MISSQLPILTEAQTFNSFQNHLILPLTIPDVVPSDTVDFDFSDIFGPLPAQTSTEVSYVDMGNSVPTTDVTELIYDDPRSFTPSHILWLVPVLVSVNL